jgi:hypothetical protein
LNTVSTARPAASRRMAFPGDGCSFRLMM